MPKTVVCFCGENQYQLKDRPAARAYCHCQTCRDVYGGDLLSATAWQSDQVVWIKQSLAIFKHPRKSITRHFCTFCGDTLFGVNRLDMVVIPNVLLARSHDGLPEDFYPEFHLFYEQRVIDISDNLPKYSEGWDGPLYYSQ